MFSANRKVKLPHAPTQAFEIKTNDHRQSKDIFPWLKESGFGVGERLEEKDFQFS